MTSVALGFSCRFTRPSRRASITSSGELHWVPSPSKSEISEAPISASENRSRYSGLIQTSVTGSSVTVSTDSGPSAASVSTTSGSSSAGSSSAGSVSSGSVGSVVSSVSSVSSVVSTYSVASSAASAHTFAGSIPRHSVSASSNDRILFIVFFLSSKNFHFYYTRYVSKVQFSSHIFYQSNSTKMRRCL